MTGVTFAIGIDPDAPMPELLERARAAEGMGFHTIYVPDHSRDWRTETPASDSIWFDGLTVLAGFAGATDRARLGSLVANPILRPPELLAREAIALDHLSGGRLTVGIGTGIAPFDHRATGMPKVTFAQRVARLDEFVAVVAGMLSAAGTFTFGGEFFHIDHDGIAATLQAPRPPITVAGASAGVRAIAVERADCWNTHGRWGVAPEAVVDDLVDLNHEVDRACEAFSRDPATLRRSVVLLGAVNPWARRGLFGELVDQLRGAGYEEFVVMWPSADDERKVFDADAELVLAQT